MRVKPMERLNSTQSFSCTFTANFLHAAGKSGEFTHRSPKERRTCRTAESVRAAQLVQFANTGELAMANTGQVANTDEHLAVGEPPLLPSAKHSESATSERLRATASDCERLKNETQHSRLSTLDSRSTQLVKSSPSVDTRQMFCESVVAPSRTTAQQT